LGKGKRATEGRKDIQGGKGKPRRGRLPGKKGHSQFVEKLSGGRVGFTMRGKGPGSGGGRKKLNRENRSTRKKKNIILRETCRGGALNKLEKRRTGDKNGLKGVVGAGAQRDLNAAQGEGKKKNKNNKRKRLCGVRGRKTQSLGEKRREEGKPGARDRGSGNN